MTFFFQWLDTVNHVIRIVIVNVHLFAIEKVHRQHQECVDVHRNTISLKINVVCETNVEKEKHDVESIFVFSG